eukprot:TRINITY_DN1222_c0_g5_i1.p1 TRINITY_DN1222_c0_g5~~TRINITY_DN1222_c0_g5_i1.p1  ORF type:complete len:100 (-),score=4.11 TRINITY_DN1222_c0_g5_i1:20-319(-)
MDERAGLLSGDGFLGESKKWKVALALASVIAIIGIGVSIGLGVQLGGYKATANPNYDVRKVPSIFLGSHIPWKNIVCRVCVDLVKISSLLRAIVPPTRI